MKAFKYVAYSWLLAQLIQLIVFLLVGINNEVIVGLIVAGFVFSIPSFLVSLLFIRIITITNAPTVVNFLIWCLLVYTAITINFYGIGLFIGDTGLLFENAQLSLPSFIAATLSLLIRFNQFEELVITQTIVDEN